MLKPIWEALLLNSGLLERGRDSNIEALVLIDITVVVAIPKATVVILIGELETFRRVDSDV